MINFTLPEDFCADADLAYTLPKAYYTEPEIFAEEGKKILSRSWICVAHGSEVAAPNQFITRKIIGENLIVVRGRDSVLRAFYNVCPHRGHELLVGSGIAKNVITCPYHAWTFKLDGQLGHARNCENVQSFDPEKANLNPISVEEYAGFVFINLDPSAAPVDSQLSGLADQMNAACPNIGQLKMAARFVTETKANWKLIVDNYMECYHCAVAHPGFSDSVQAEGYTHSLHGNWTVQVGFAKSSEKSFKLDDSAKNRKFSGFWAWPCTMFNIPPGDGFMTVIYELPVDEETTLQHYEIYFANAELTDEQTKLIAWYRDVFRPEDLRLVEGVQKGLKSRGYRGQGRIMTDRDRTGLSEHGIAHFHHLVARALGDDE